MERRVELLAPAGNMEGFYGALHAGADAVYLGGSRFGARAYADNFTTEELLAAIRYAHILGRKVYLTVNTLVKETETEELRAELEPLYEAGLDAAIVQDIGVFALLRVYFPDLKLHVSTQMTVTSGYGAALLKEMGAVRVVPARELSLPEIVALKEASGLEIETFVHGAMCYSYSGQCLFSSILGGRSGNRGRCAQPCRLPYRVDCGSGPSSECYPLSLKDMCAIEHIPELIEAGIDSFKIEGRMKKAEYTAGVTAIYRKYIDRYYAGVKGGVEPDDLKALGCLYIRSERLDGYYFRRNGRDMVTLHDPAYSGSDETLLADIRKKYLADRPKIGISMRAEFRVGQPALIACRADAAGQEIEISVSGEPVSEALKQPISAENLVQQLGKLGDTAFYAEKIETELDENAFYPLKAINELRRLAAERLANALAATNAVAPGRLQNEAARAISASVVPADAEPTSSLPTPQWHISLRNAEQLQAVKDLICSARREAPQASCTRIYLEADLLTEAAESADGLFWQQCAAIVSQGCELAAALPYIIRKEDEAWLERLWKVYTEHTDLFAGFLARSTDGMGFLRRHALQAGGREISVCGDAGLYVWNKAAVRELRNVADGFGLKGFCLPYELKAADQRRLLEEGGLPGEKIIYGRIPLMLTANCVLRTISGCRADGKTNICKLTDRCGIQFPVLCDCRHCLNVIYNSVPLSLHRTFSKWQDKTALRLDFTIENGAETAAILRYFAEDANFAEGAKAEPPFGEYTTGHEKRGAE